MAYYVPEKSVIGNHNGGVKLSTHETELKDEVGKTHTKKVDELEEIVKIVDQAKKGEASSATWIEGKRYHLVNTNEDDRFLVFSSDNSRALIFYDKNYFFLFPLVCLNLTYQVILCLITLIDDYYF